MVAFAYDQTQCLRWLFCLISTQPLFVDRGSRILLRVWKSQTFMQTFTFAVLKRNIWFAGRRILLLMWKFLEHTSEDALLIGVYTVDRTFYVHHWPQAINPKRLMQSLFLITLHSSSDHWFRLCNAEKNLYCWGCSVFAWSMFNIRIGHQSRDTVTVSFWAYSPVIRRNRLRLMTIRLRNRLQLMTIRLRNRLRLMTIRLRLTTGEYAKKLRVK